jgi:hypothetical protein
MVEKLRDGTYHLGDAFEAAAAPTPLRAALRSWSVLPMYLGLLILYAGGLIAWYFKLLAWPT